MNKIKQYQMNDLKKKIQQSVELKLNLEKLSFKIFKSIETISKTLKNKKKIFLQQAPLSLHPKNNRNERKKAHKTIDVYKTSTLSPI